MTQSPHLDHSLGDWQADRGIAAAAVGPVETPSADPQAPARRRRAATARPLADIAGSLLVALAEHRLLTCDQLRILCGWRDEAGCLASRQWISDQLHGLEALGYVRWIRRRGGEGNVWFVTPRGAEAAALTGGAADRRIVVLRPSQVQARTQAHTLAVNAVGVALTRWARGRGDVCAWTNEVSHKVLEGTGPSKGLLNADAYVRYDSQQAPGQWAFFGFFVELDRAHVTLQQLGEKLRRYVHFTTFTPRGSTVPAWQTFYGWFPTVLFAFASPSQRRRGEPKEAFSERTRLQLMERIDGLAAFCDADPLVRRALSHDDGAGSLRVRLCLLEDLERVGPFDKSIALDPATGRWSALIVPVTAGADHRPQGSDAEPAA